MLIVDDIEQKRLLLTFSFTMLRERIQRLLNFCSPAAVPTEWNVQLEVESEVFNESLDQIMICIFVYPIISSNYQCV